MSLKNLTEQEFAALVKRRDCDPVERVRSSTDARRTTRESGSSFEAAIQQTGSRRGESASSPYRSKLERAWANYLQGLWMLKAIQLWLYEPISFKLAPGKRYRPDFMVWKSDGAIEFQEVKGRWTKNRRDGMTHLKWAAQLYPMFSWLLVERAKNGGWDETRIREM